MIGRPLAEPRTGRAGRAAQLALLFSKPRAMRSASIFEAVRQRPTGGVHAASRPLPRIAPLEPPYEPEVARTLRTADAAGRRAAEAVPHRGRQPRGAGALPQHGRLPAQLRDGGARRSRGRDPPHVRAAAAASTSGACTPRCLRAPAGVHGRAAARRRVHGDAGRPGLVGAAAPARAALRTSCTATGTVSATALWARLAAEWRARAAGRAGRGGRLLPPRVVPGERARVELEEAGERFPAGTG